jgi:FixJ family two-component response regulator
MEQYRMSLPSGNRLHARMMIPHEAATGPTVHVIDDDDSFRTSMIRLLNASGFAAVGYACAGEFLLAQDGEASGCILLDISMPGPSGIDLLKALVSRGSAPPIVFVTGRDDVFTSVDVMKAGAFDYIVKPVGADHVLQVVRRALDVDAKRAAARRELAELRARFELLTPAESTIFFGVVANRLNKQIAADLGTCERTIKAQRARMMAKLQVATVPELVRAAKLLDSAKTPVVDRSRLASVSYSLLSRRRP